MKSAFGAAALIAAPLAAIAPGPSHAFSMLTKDGAWHEVITRDALAETFAKDTLAQFAGSKGAPGAIGAPDLNAAMNDAAHCDNGDSFAAPGYPQSAKDAQARLDACRQYIFDQIDAAVKDLAPLVRPDGSVVSSEFPSIVFCTFVGDAKGRAKCNVLQRLGKAMHAAQDFYSHTNWVDQSAAGAASAQNPAGLGKSGAAPYLGARTAAFPPGLISGCFDAKSAKSKLTGEDAETSGCNYPGGVRVKHAFLNKDQPTSPRAAAGGNFERARAAAVAETKAKWADFEKRVRGAYPGKRGDVMLCAMKSDKAGSCK